MADNPDAVRVGYAGAVYTAPVGTVAPTTPFAAWGTGWLEMGLISDDGLSEGASQDVTEFSAWGYPSAPVRTQVGQEESTWTMTFIETSAKVLSVFFGVPYADMTSTAATGGNPQFAKFSKEQQTTTDIRALGIDIIDGNDRKRIIVARAQITDRGDISYKTDELEGYQVTFKALLASDGTAWQRMVTNVAVPV